VQKTCVFLHIKKWISSIFKENNQMEERQAGVTALITAYARAYHATHDSPKIFDDFVADQMYTPEEHALFDQNLAANVKDIDPELALTHPDQATALARVMQLHYCPITLSRSRYTEDCLEVALQQGAEQYVILGAGFDTFAFRRPELAERLQIFEVDHPVTQAQKRQRIAYAGWDLPAHLHFVSIDFTKESLPEALQRSTYRPEKSSFFSWLGVTFYLTEDVVFGTLRAISGMAANGSAIIFDYIDADGFIPEKAGKRVQLMQKTAAMIGEPMKVGFEPQGLAGKLAGVGFHLEEDLGPAEIERRYFQGRHDLYHAFEHVHFARAMVNHSLQAI
jgi:methyltransferase (TIGR00027 family)